MASNSKGTSRGVALPCGRLAMRRRRGPVDAFLGCCLDMFTYPKGPQHGYSVVPWPWIKCSRWASRVVVMLCRPVLARVFTPNRCTGRHAALSSIDRGHMGVDMHDRVLYTSRVPTPAA